MIPVRQITDYLAQLEVALENRDNHRTEVARRNVLDRLRVYRRRRRSDRYRFAVGALFDAVMFTDFSNMTSSCVEVLKKYATSLFVHDTKDVTDEFLPEMRRELNQAGFRLRPEMT